jgi:hypothetical protein
LVDAFILPAVRSDLPLPENPVAVSQLQARIESVRNR